MRKIIFGICVLSVVVLVAYWRGRSQKPPVAVAYAGDRKITVWSTTAQVREPVATLEYGDRLEILNRQGDYAEVRATKGTGWVEERQLMSSDLWGQAESLLSKSNTMPIEAVGHTKVVTNVHSNPGRDEPRIRQLAGNVPVDLLERRVEPVPQTGAETSESAGAEHEGGAKQEEWWLVRAHPKNQGAIAGWVLGRFVDLDLPDPLPDYVSAAAMRPVAWFVLKEVPDPSGVNKPQYLLVGTHPGEGQQPCDFTMLRGYTWSTTHERYETAYVESDICGYLPISFEHPANPAGDVLFHFRSTGDDGETVRNYRMRQTIIRHIVAGEPPPAHRKPKG